MAEEIFDLLILGGGPAGYLAAERMGASGKKVALIEKEHLGGVCLNRGCIPTKALLHSAKLYRAALHSEEYGVSFENPQYSLEKAMNRKDEVVESLREGIAYLMKRNRVTVVRGSGRIRDRNTIEVDGKSYNGKAILIATGSSPLRLAGIEGPGILTSDEMLNIKELPGRVVVIGGGVIGLEFASYFSLLGIPVSVIELLPEVLPTMDEDMSRLLRRSMPGISFNLGCRVESVEGGRVIFSKNGKEEKIEADTVLMAVGRLPNTEGLGFEGLSLDFDRHGIRVNDRMQTNVPGVYAIGDINGMSQLAHSAYRMAEVAVHNLTGSNDHFRDNAIPAVVYSYPEAAGVGLTERQAGDLGREIRVGKLPMRVNGRFLVEHGNQPGICKIIVDAETGALLGVQMIGAECSEMIFGAAALIEAELCVQDISEIVFPHPTVSEIIRESVLSVKL